MRIRHVKLVGVRKVAGLQADCPRRHDTDLIVLHGGRASGKTTVLDALAAAISRVTELGFDSRWDSLPAPGVDAAKVAIDWELSEEERTRMSVTDPLVSSESIIGSSRSSPSAPVVLNAVLGERGSATRGSVHYLHDTRDLEGPLAFGADDAALRMRLTSRNAKFGELYDVLDQPAFGAARQLASARFGELCPGFGIEGVRRFGTSFAPMITDEARGEARTADKVSTSERQAFLAALYTSRTPIVDSCILVDAPELGFGDTGALDLIRALFRWTTRTQLVVATASDAVRDMPETAHVVELSK